jgi:hypothetical protein
LRSKDACLPLEEALSTITTNFPFAKLLRYSSDKANPNARQEFFFTAILKTQRRQASKSASKKSLSPVIIASTFAAIAAWRSFILNSAYFFRMASQKLTWFKWFLRDKRNSFLLFGIILLLKARWRSWL